MKTNAKTPLFPFHHSAPIVLPFSVIRRGSRGEHAAWRAGKSSWAGRVFFATDVQAPVLSSVLREVVITLRSGETSGGWANATSHTWLIHGVTEQVWSAGICHRFGFFGIAFRFTLGVRGLDPALELLGAGLSSRPRSKESRSATIPKLRRAGALPNRQIVVCGATKRFGGETKAGCAQFEPQIVTKAVAQKPVNHRGKPGGG